MMRIYFYKPGKIAAEEISIYMKMFKLLTGWTNIIRLTKKTIICSNSKTSNISVFLCFCVSVIEKKNRTHCDRLNLRINNSD